MFGGKCVECGYSSCHRALSFHHIGDKTNVVGKVSSLGDAIEEARSCVLLCENCHRDRHNAQYYGLEFKTGRKDIVHGRATRKKMIDLLGNMCMKCGNVYKACVYDFHHRRKTFKKFKLTTREFAYKKWKELKREAMKCDLLCANCHMERHQEAG